MSRIQHFELTNKQGASLHVINLGARITALFMPTERMGPVNTVLGYNEPDGYRTDAAYHGAIVGRYCNRIANGRFSLYDTDYQLAVNDGNNHLHGGPLGLHQKYWDPIKCSDQSTLHLRTQSADGECGYPGNLTIDVYYQLSDDNTVSIRWKMTSDQTTIANVTSHSYFNLAGYGDIRDHYLRIPASHYTPHNAQQIPTGELAPVDGTPFDLRQFRRLQSVIDSKHPDICKHFGLDHNWAGGAAGQLTTLAQLYNPNTALMLTVSATLPGIQCYTGNQLPMHSVHRAHQGICLEPQFYPDTPNNAHFPSCLLHAGDTVSHEIQLAFTRQHYRHS